MEQIRPLNTRENRCVFCLEHTVKMQLLEGSQADPAAGTTAVTSAALWAAGKPLML